MVHIRSSVPDEDPLEVAIKALEKINRFDLDQSDSQSADIVLGLAGSTAREALSQIFIIQRHKEGK